MRRYLLTEATIKKMIFDFMFDEYQPDEEEQEQHNSYKKEWFETYQKQLDTYEENDNYKKAYNLFMEYFDYLPDEDKENLDKQLNELGL